MDRVSATDMKLCGLGIILVLNFVCGGVDPLQMLTKGQQLIGKAGETKQLECEFVSNSFSLFDNPIVWRKTQRLEETQINMMGNLMEPFASAKRFRATFQPHEPRYLFGLVIQDLSLEDNGNYTCEISGPHNAVLGSVTHRMFVRAQIDRVMITDDNSTAAPIQTTPIRVDNNRPMTSATIGGMTSLVYVENQPGVLRCVAFGGSPPPDIDVFVGQTDITNRLTLSKQPTMSRQRGLRLIYYTTERATNQFIARPSDDGQTLRCVVSVPGSPDNVSFARINVHYSAIIQCEDATPATVGDHNVCLRCEIRSKPSVSALFWIIDSNGTTVSEGQVVNDYWILNMDRADDDITETMLFIRQVTPESFRRYTLVAENAVAVRKHDVLLIPRMPTKKSRGEPTLQRSITPSKREPALGGDLTFTRSGSSSHHVTYRLGLLTGCCCCCCCWLRFAILTQVCLALILELR